MTPFTLDELKQIAAAIPDGDDALGLVARRVNEATMELGETKRQWDNWCTHFGLGHSDFGRVFTIKGRSYKAIGINPGAPKFCVQAQRLPDGKQFRVPASCVK